MPISRTTVVGWDVGELVEFIDSGIEHCRAGRWEKGADYLGYVAERSHADLSHAGLYLSYLGCAVARIHEQTKEGRALCERAVKAEFYQPENWANLAEVMMLEGERRQAIAAIEQGLKIDAQNERLRQVHESLGRRRRPIVGFLNRRNPLNHVLGRVRSDLLGARRREPQRPTESTS